MTDKQINAWLRRRFREIGWALVGYYVLVNILAVVVSAVDVAKQALWNLAVGEPLMSLDMDAVMNNAWGYIAAIAVSLLILHGWKGREYWKREVFVKNRSMTVPVFACMLCFCMGAQLLSSLWVTALELVLNLFGMSAMGLLESVSGSTESFSMFLYMGIFAPVSEEILFRGYVLRTLRPYGKRFAIFGSALLFSLFHGNLLQIPYAFLAGLLLGYVTVEYSAGWAVVLHVFNNLVLAEGLGRLTAGLSEMTAGMLQMALFGGALLVSLAVLLRKREQIAQYRRGEWIDRRCVKCLLTNSGVLILTAVMLVNIVLSLNI